MSNNNNNNNNFGCLSSLDLLAVLTLIAWAVFDMDLKQAVTYGLAGWCTFSILEVSLVLAVRYKIL